MDLTHWQQRFDRWMQENFSDADAAHDIGHVRRVWATAQTLMANEDVNGLVVLTACYFHDSVSLPKNHPQRAEASRMAAAHTVTLLAETFSDFPEALYPAVAHAIEAHSFSARIAPQSTEAKIVQDADRLEALGAIGLARVFAVTGSLGGALFDDQDPFADARELDDKRFALDHFQTKLLALPATMQTEKGRELAQHNAQFLVQFMAKLGAELKGDFYAIDESVLRRFDARD